MSVERRANDRIPMNLKASCRVPATPQRVTVLDMSHSGCRLSFDLANVPSGSTVHLDLNPVQSVTGQVVWVSSRGAGVQFHRRLNRSIAVDLGIEQAVEEEVRAPVEYVPEERSGLPHWIRRVFKLGRRDPAMGGN